MSQNNPSAENNVILIGATGMLGTDLHTELMKRGWDVIAPDRSDIDLEDVRTVESYFLFAEPNWIINTAAYTAVDKAENDEFRANLINATGAFSLSRQSRFYKAGFIHISTDFVFDGTKSSPYTEEDEPNPLSVYGKSKRQGEILVMNENPNSIIVRTSWLFGANGKCFPKTILRAALDNKPLRVVSDQIGSPTYTRDLATAIANLMEKDTPPGYYHIANKGQVSWYEFANFVLKACGINYDIQPISSSEWQAPASRPKYSVLSTSKYEALGFSSLPDWKDAVQRFIQDLKNTPDTELFFPKG